MARHRGSLVFFMLLVGTISVVFGLTFLPEPRAIDNTIPYIYYYENTRDALVIERADGSDSRILMPGGFPAGNYAIGMHHMDWSPSGRWAAWHGGTIVYEGGVRVKTGWLVSTDGKTQVNLGERYGLYTIERLIWSPVEDLLLIVGTDRTHYLRTRMIIIDPATGEIVTQANYTTLDLLWSIPVDWFRDGSGIYFDVTQYQAHLIGSLTIEGSTYLRDYPDNLRQLKHFSSGRILQPVMLDNSNREPTLVIENLSSGKQVPVSERAAYDREDESDYEVFWNDDLTRAAIQACVEDECQLFALDWEQATTILVSRGKFLFNPDDLRNFDSDYQPHWSPDGRYLVYRDDDDQIAVFDMTTRTSSPILPFEAEMRWVWSGAATGWLHSGRHQPIYRYLPETRQIERVIAAAQQNNSGVFVSPDERYIVEERSARPVEMHDTQTGAVLSWTQPSATRQGLTSWIDAMIWSDDSRWFFSASDLFSAGGGQAPDAWAIHSLDGTVNRETGLCYTCAGFVPERALPYLAEGSPASVIPQPVIRLPHPGEVVGVGWSRDGTRLASVSSGYKIPCVLFIRALTGTETVLVDSYPVESACGGSSSPVRIDWSADSQFVTLDNGFAIETWDLIIGIPVESGDSPDDEASAVGSIPVKIWDPGWTNWSRDGRTPLVLDREIELLYLLRDGVMKLSNVRALTFADVRANSPVIVAGDYYNRAKLWDAATGERLPDLPMFAGDAMLSPDGKQIAVASTEQVTILNVADLLK